ncbi:hypothetical protein PUN28_004483 [Cardiocondyla obscurior]|uniref:Uncharacterized protein n=1 Tax=Cardiocondyla obscurior TaxID=286306 RepID=A0AAW2GDK1_9HYME
MTPRQAAAAGVGLRIERRKREATSRGPNFSEAMRAAREPLRKSDDKSESRWFERVSLLSNANSSRCHLVPAAHTG